VLWYWLVAGAAAVLAILSLRGERGRAAYAPTRHAEHPATLPPASVIVPVKGEDEGLRENLAALAALDYPDFELIVAARTAADIPHVMLPAKVRVVLAHGHDPDTGEKVQNLAAAVKAVRKRSEILAFADSDGRVTRGWLRALAAPLAEHGVGAATGFRWFTPSPAGFWTLLRGVWDAVAAGTLGPGDNSFAWGGAVAVYKETFFAARVPEYWKGAVSDDYALAAAIHAAGLSIAWAPGALTPCFERLPARRLFAWMRRQMMITRCYNRRLWGTALAAHVVYCGGMAAAVAASALGHRAILWALAAQLVPGMLKGLNRARLASQSLPELRAWFRRHTWAHAVWTPLATWAWLVALASSALGDTIEWRGNRYPLRPPGWMVNKRL